MIEEYKLITVLPKLLSYIARTSSLFRCPADLDVIAERYITERRAWPESTGVAPRLDFLIRAGALQLRNDRWLNKLRSLLRSRGEFDPVPTRWFQCMNAYRFLHWANRNNVNLRSEHGPVLALTRYLSEFGRV